MSDLFENLLMSDDKVFKPLAERLRPRKLEEVVGQETVLGREGLFLSSIKQNKFGSYILVGPPGVGKTSIARLIAAESEHAFIELSAIDATVSNLRKIFDGARNRIASNKGTVLFIDEIHRFTKTQQDSLLPHIEGGIIRLIGATTEDPNFELNSALLSRLFVLKLGALNKTNLEEILVRSEEEMKKPLPASKDGRAFLLSSVQGDARRLINLVEIIFQSEKELEKEEIESLFAYRTLNYSKSGSDHFNCISALQKSIRGSDVDAALYWLARMMNAGENPKYILRRILRTSYEDVGLADLQAQQICLNAWSSFEKLGSPEGDIVLAHAVIYLALSPKSNSAYAAYARACSSARNTSQFLPPKHLLITNGYEDVSEAKKYLNDHDTDEGCSGRHFLPDELLQANFYRPIDRGQEQELVKKLSYFNKLRELKSS